MDLYSNLSGFALALVALGSLAAAVSVAVIAQVVVTNRHERVARQESIRTYYRRFALTH